jgi:hypothetical protein
MKPLLTCLVVTLALGFALPEAEARRPRYYSGYRDYAPQREARVYVRRPRFEFYYGPSAAPYRSYSRSYAPYSRGYSQYGYPSYSYGPRTRGPVFYDRDDWEDYREDLEDRREDYEDWREDREEEYEERMEELRERREERWEDWRDRFDD